MTCLGSFSHLPEQVLKIPFFFFFWPGYYFILCHFEDFKQFISKSHSFCLIISNVEGHEVYCLLDL